MAPITTSSSGALNVAGPSRPAASVCQSVRAGPAAGGRQASQGGAAALARAVAPATAVAGAWQFPLHVAVQQGNPNQRLAAIYTALDGGADINGKDDDGLTPLQRAVTAEGGEAVAEAVEALVKRGADVRAVVNDESTTLLHHAARYGKPGAVGPALRALVTAGLAVGSTDDWGETALFDAVLNRDAAAAVEAFEAVRQLGADPLAKGHGGATLLHRASANKSGEAAAALVPVLVAAGIDVNSTANRGKTALHWAALEGTADAITALVAAGASLEAKHCDSYTPLHVAAQLCRPEAVAALLAAGSSASAVDSHGVQPLHLAVRCGEDSGAMATVAAALKEAGAVLNAEGVDQATPLHLAAYNECEAVAGAAVTMLIEGGVSVAARNKRGEQALHWAAVNKSPAAAAAAAKALFAKGADSSACDEDGDTPLMMALDREDAADCGRLIELLLPGGEAAGQSAGRDGDAAGGSGPDQTRLLNLLGEQLRQQSKGKRPAEEGGEQQRECVVCLEAPRSVALTPCGHVCLCAGCAEKSAVKKQCPVCRKKVTRVQPVYFP